MGKTKTKSSKTKHAVASDRELELTVEDPRFSTALSRPHFQKPPKDVSKVVLDERFASVLTDPRFQLQEKDRYGRRRKKKGKAKEELSAFYTIEEKEERNDNKNDETNSADQPHDGQQLSDNSDDEHEEVTKDDAAIDQDPASRIAYLTALSRGELDVSSSSSDDEEDDDDDASASSDDDNDVGLIHESIQDRADVLDPSSHEEEIEMIYEPSPYLAVLNMDWGHVRAEDIFAIMASFTQPGAVKRVQVFPSDFGMEQMTKEEKYGPTDIWRTGEKTNEKHRADKPEDEESEDGSSEDNDHPVNPDWDKSAPESDYDPEKLRAYEVSKLKYYFAIVEFYDPEQANIAYKELDGHELEHSSAEMDLRAIPPADLEGIIRNRKLRDEATALSGNYQPPDFVVNALQQTSVECTWEDADANRERTLTKYSTGQVGSWNALAEEDDLRAYLASDQSSDDDSKAKKKAVSKRALLGLDSDDEQDDNAATGERGKSQSASDDEDSSEESGDDRNSVGAKEMTFIPGSKKLEEKIRSKLRTKDEAVELTPWQQYQEKRKQKKKERKQAARNLRKSKVETSNDHSDGENDEDDFFVDESDQQLDSVISNRKGVDVKNVKNPVYTTKQNAADELELLLAGEGDDEDVRDFDIRGLQRIEKNKDKKLRGSRKRKELAATADVSGKDFKVDVKDDRFAAVLEGSDSRFGIDRMDPNFKETPAMREILQEQMKRRKTKKQKAAVVAPDTNADSSDVQQVDRSSGAAALTALVKSLKRSVAKVSQ